MATKFRIDPSKPYAHFVNGSIYYDQLMPAAALANQVIQAYPGDPLVGVTLEGSNPPLKWEDATEVQKAIYNYYGENGLDKSGIAVDLQTNPGPVEPWNFSYTQWGLPMGGKQ